MLCGRRPPSSAWGSIGRRRRFLTAGTDAPLRCGPHNRTPSHNHTDDDAQQHCSHPRCQTFAVRRHPTANPLCAFAHSFVTRQHRDHLPPAIEPPSAVVLHSSLDGVRRPSSTSPVSLPHTPPLPPSIMTHLSTLSERPPSSLPYASAPRLRAHVLRAHQRAGTLLFLRRAHAVAVPPRGLPVQALIHPQAVGAPLLRARLPRPLLLPLLLRLPEGRPAPLLLRPSQAHRARPRLPQVPLPLLPHPALPASPCPPPTARSTSSRRRRRRSAPRGWSTWPGPSRRGTAGGWGWGRVRRAGVGR